jgi:hypothetical protein
MFKSKKDRALLGDARGATILEFALVLPLFLSILFSGVEFGLFMFASNLVQRAVHDGSRLALTGSNYAERQALEGSGTTLSREDYIRAMILERLGGLADNGTLTISSVVHDNISNLNSAGVPEGGSVFGKGGQVIAYDVAFEWNVMTPGILTFLSQDGKMVMSSSLIVQNENFR